ncbi:MAG: hypothetical protein A2X08_10800 [Bacteroidetes bacterium GWA2_32_17]|nr:MAG: hypothetical protein A2X08_10800 [Bacteroidetes bacterium GWA2_32_17]
MVISLNKKGSSKLLNLILLIKLMLFYKLRKQYLLNNLLYNFINTNDITLILYFSKIKLRML